MMLLNLCLLILSYVTAGLALSNSNLQLRNSPRALAKHNVRQVSSAITNSKRDTTLKNSTTLDTSWNGATLFSIQLEGSNGQVGINAGVEITCTTCYIKGTATAQVTISENFNITQAFDDFKNEVEHDIGVVTNETVDAFETYFKTLALDITSLNPEKFVDDLAFPTVNDTSFDLEIPDIPQASLLFQFDGLELYMAIDTVLSGGSTYSVNIYTSNTPIGVSAGKDKLGVTFSIDLVLSVNANIDITSGFHIKLDDSVTIDLALFSHNVSTIKMNGGHFEFLPVTVQSSGVQLTALLKVGLQVGLNVASPSLNLDGIKFATFSAGAAAGVWMNIAEFSTNVTAAPAGDSSGCKVFVEEVYSMAIGAQAGATLAINDHSWGPTPNTSTVLFYTTLESRCASTITSTTALVTARAAKSTGLTTTTLTTEDTYTATQCLSTGLLNCPISLQITSKQTVTSTLVTSVPSGSTATFPVTSQTAVASTIAFGTNVKPLTSSSGTSTSFNPTTSPTSGIAGVIDGKTGGVSNKIIIGVSVGVGVPVFIAIIAGWLFCIRRKRAARSGVITYTTSESYVQRSQTSIKKSPNVVVSENLR